MGATNKPWSQSFPKRKNYRVEGPSTYHKKTVGRSKKKPKKGQSNHGRENNGGRNWPGSKKKKKSDASEGEGTH